MNDELLEKFYDVIDASNDFLYEKFKKNYFELILMTTKNILEGRVVCDLDDEDSKKLEAIYEPLYDLSIPTDVVLKALQAIILKGFKESRELNGGTTPDTIGMFIGYLILKLEGDKKRSLNILDPLVGTGNMLLTAYNMLDRECRLYACDHNELMVKLCKMCADMIGEDVSIYFQDTFNLVLNNMDYIIFDLPNVFKYDKGYFPFDVIMHYKEMLNDGGSIICVIPNSFFDNDKDGNFKKELIKDMQIVGLIELPSNMFVGEGKSILILKRSLQRGKSMVVKLPSFSDQVKLSHSLGEIETWFENNMNK